eukprot:CAMPEP_0113676754 /NCGR_PEP_ID=MMETSP0038_2-20120614/8836_1 /TAXON_ID=2898 /ORGANISM="Cryptomonas paramecium" /LENGTH=1618 /DNA_ID=CAMNT_0000593853 /DNA_START=352 /DNA_END=5208 /DNA_ORIENTATION=+ /assembly_acc=CAM_ASM_000170
MDSRLDENYEMIISSNQRDPLRELILEKINQVKLAKSSLGAFQPSDVVVLGDTGVGKTYFINMLLLTSESTQYGFLVINLPTSECALHACLKTELEAMKEIARIESAYEIADSVELRVLSMEKLKSAEFEKERERDRSAFNSLRSFWKANDGKATQTPFRYLLEVASPGSNSSTTSDIVRVQHGCIFHFWIRFLSEDKILADLKSFDWKKYSENENLDADDNKMFDLMATKYLHFVRPEVVDGSDDFAFEVMRLKRKVTNLEFDLRNQEVRDMAGKSLVVSGRGFDAQADRIFVADELEKLLKNRSLALAVDQIEVYCPSDLLAEGIALLDVPGTNDNDPRKYKRARDAVEGADVVLVVCRQNISTSESTTRMMESCELFERAFLNPTNSRLMFVSLNNEQGDLRQLDAADTSKRFAESGWDETRREIVRYLLKAVDRANKDDSKWSPFIADLKKAKEQCNRCVLELKHRYFCCRALLWASALAGRDLMDPSELFTWENGVDAVGCQSFISSLLSCSRNSVVNRVTPFLGELKSLAEPIGPKLQKVPHIDESARQELISVMRTIRQSNVSGKNFQPIDDELYESFDEEVSWPTYCYATEDELEAVLKDVGRGIAVTPRHSVGAFRKLISNLNVEVLNQALHPSNKGRWPQLDLFKSFFGSRYFTDCIDETSLEKLKDFASRIADEVSKRTRKWATDHLVGVVCGGRGKRHGKNADKNDSPVSDQTLEATVRDSVKNFLDDNAVFKATITSFFSQSPRAMKSFSSMKVLGIMWDEVKMQFIQEVLGDAQLPVNRDTMCTWMESSSRKLTQRIRELFVDKLKNKILDCMVDLIDHLAGKDSDGQKRKRLRVPLYLFVFRNALRPLHQCLTDDAKLLQDEDPRESEVLQLLQRSYRFLSQEIEREEAKTSLFWSANQMSMRFQCRALGRLDLSDSSRSLDPKDFIVDTSLAFSRENILSRFQNDTGNFGLDESGLCKMLADYEDTTGVRLTVGDATQDGSSLFDSLSQFLDAAEAGSVQRAKTLRCRLVKFTEDWHHKPSSRDRFKAMYSGNLPGVTTIDEWVKRMSNDLESGDLVIIEAFSRLYQTRVLVHTPGLGLSENPVCFPLAPSQGLNSFPPESVEISNGCVNIARIYCSHSGFRYIPLFANKVEDIASDNLTRLNEASRQLVQQRKIPLAFDIDDTLIYGGEIKRCADGSRLIPKGGYACSDLGFPELKDHFMLLRPCVIHSLAHLSKLFLLGICTAASKQWADCFLKLIDVVGTKLKIETKSLFEARFVCAIDSHKNAGAKKSFRQTFPGYSTEICLAVDDQLAWCEDDVDQVVRIPPFSVQHQNYWTSHQHAEEVKRWERQLITRRKYMLRQFGVGPKDDVAPGPPYPGFGISMRKICTAAKEMEDGLTQPNSLGAESRLSSLRSARSTDGAVTVLLDETCFDPKHGLPSLLDLGRFSAECGLSTLMLPSLDARIQRMVVSRDSARLKLAERVFAARAAAAQVGDVRVLHIWCTKEEEERVLREGKARPSASGGRGGRRVPVMDLTLAWAAQTAGAYVTTNSERVQEACEGAGVAWVTPEELFRLLEKKAQAGEASDRPKAFKAALALAARGHETRLTQAVEVASVAEAMTG